MKRVLITRISGFVGSHLAEYLLGENLEIYEAIRWRSKTDSIDHIRGKLKLVQADMKDSHSLESIVKEVKPDYVFHLAAQSFVLMSWRAPTDTLETNIIGTAHLLEAIRKLECDPAIQIPGSSEEYGLVHENEIPIKETASLRSLSPYGVSKVAEDLLTWQYYKSYGLKIVRTRAFNHTGPRRAEVFVTSTFARQIAEIEKGLKEPVINVGNLEAIRDFSDVRDIVKAYWLAVNECEWGEVYNICSEKGRTIQSILDLLLQMSDKKIKVNVDASRLRPSDVGILVGKV